VFEYNGRANKLNKICLFWAQIAKFKRKGAKKLSTNFFGNIYAALDPRKLKYFSTTVH